MDPVTVSIHQADNLAFLEAQPDASFEFARLAATLIREIPATRKTFRTKESIFTAITKI